MFSNERVNPLFDKWVPKMPLLIEKSVPTFHEKVDWSKAVISEFPDRGIAGLVQAGHPALKN